MRLISREIAGPSSGIPHDFTVFGHCLNLGPFVLECCGMTLEVRHDIARKHFYRPFPFMTVGPFRAMQQQAAKAAGFLLFGFKPGNGVIGCTDYPVANISAGFWCEF